MGLNLLGLGLFGKDKGATKVVDTQTQMLAHMGDTSQKLDKILTQSKLQTFLQALSLDAVQGVAEKLEHIATAGRQLTTSFEAQIVAANKAGHATAANLGYSTKAMGKFSAQATNLGISLNIGTEEAGKAIYAWEQGAEQLKMVGIDSASTAAKVEQIFKVDPSKFIWTLKEMNQTMGMSDAAVKAVTDSTLAWGQQSADVSKAMGTMQQQVDALSQRAHAFGKTLKGDELAEWAVSANQAKQLMYALTNNADKAEKAVDQLSQQALESGKNMGKMFAGTSDDLTQWQQSLAVAGVDIDEQFKLMRKGPLGFIQGLSGMVKKAGGFSKMTGEQMNFIKKQMEQALGEDTATEMFKIFEQGDEAVENMIKTLPKATEDMGKLAKAAFKTGRTLQDEFDLAESSFVARIRAQSTVGQTFVKDTQVAFKDWGDTLINISKKGGPLGMVTNKLIEMHQIGALALIPQALRPMAGVFGTIVKEVGPLVGIMGSLGFRLSMLASPITLVVLGVAALVGWFMSARKEGKKTLSFTETLQKMWKQTGEFFSKTLPKYLMKGFEYLSQAGAWLAKVVPPLLKKFGAFIQKNYPVVVEALKRTFEQFFTVALPWLKANVPPLLAKLAALIKEYAPVVVKSLIKAYDWLYTELASGVVWVLGKLWEYLPEIISTVGALAKGALGVLKEMVLGIFDGVRQYLVEKFPELAGPINAFFGGLKMYYEAIFAGANFLIDTIVSGWTQLWDYVTGIFDGSIKDQLSVWEMMGLFVGEWIADIKFYFVNLWLDVKQGAVDMWEGLKSAAKSAVDWMGELLSGAVDAFTAPFKAIDEWADKLFRHSIDTDMQKTFQSAGKYADKFSTDMSKSMGAAMAPLSSVAPSVSFSTGTGAAPKPLPPSARPKPSMGASEREAALVSAVNNPAWYARYEQVFTNQMAALMRTVQENNAPAAGRAGKKPATAPKGNEANYGIYGNMPADIVGGR